jgi:hypothetical protein
MQQNPAIPTELLASIDSRRMIMKDGLGRPANRTPLAYTTRISPPQHASPYGPEIEPQIDHSLRAGPADSGMLSIHGLNTGTRALTNSPVSRETTVRP